MKKFYMKGGYGYVQIQYRLLELINECEGDMGTVPMMRWNTREDLLSHTNPYGITRKGY